MRSLSIFLILTLFCSTSFGKEVRISLDKKSHYISFSLANQWNKEDGLPGVDHLYVYPHGKVRDLISVLISPPTKMKFTASKETEQKKYEQAKQKWAKKRGVHINKFYPLKTSLKDKVSRYVFGLNYSVGGRDIIEYSHYYFCQNRMINIKLLGDNSKSFVTIANRAIQGSIRCE